MAQELTDQRPIFLSTLPARRHNRQVALTVVAVSAVLFGALAPFAKVPLSPIWAFIPVYGSALAVIDLMTAVLLFGQFSFLRSRALLVLASAYLFTTFIIVAHALTFPGLFSPAGMLGAGPQTTAWLYMIWHAGFPLAVIAYTYLVDSRRVRRPWLAVAVTMPAMAQQRALSDPVVGAPNPEALFTSKDVPGLIYDGLYVSKESLATRRDDWAKVVGVWFKTVAPASHTSR